MSSNCFTIYFQQHFRFISFLYLLTIIPWGYKIISEAVCKMQNKIKAVSVGYKLVKRYTKVVEQVSVLQLHNLCRYTDSQPAFLWRGREKQTLKKITILINTFLGKQDHTFTKIYKLYNWITTKKFSSSAANSGWCGALKLLPNTKNTSMLYQDLAARKSYFHLHYF